MTEEERNERFAADAARMARELVASLAALGDTPEPERAQGEPLPPRLPMLRDWPMLQPFQLDGRQHWLLRLEDEHGDWIWAEPSGVVPSFVDDAALRHHAREAGMAHEPTSALPSCNLDSLQAWLDRPLAETLDARAFMDCWQLLDVVATTVGLEDPFGKLDGLVYRHLWIALHAKPGDVPPWQPREVTQLAAHLSWGLKVFRAQVRTLKPA